MAVQQTVSVQPYLFFDGKCEEALEFYKGAIGAKVEMLMRFKENPDKPDPSHMPPSSGDKVMHAAFRVGDTQILASDGECAGKTTFQGFGLALNAKDDAEAEKLFTAVGKGGKVQLPLTKTFFASKFGMVADRFGIMWMVIAEEK
ncbi:MAG: VOC family protein [Rhodospirillales bacterium]|nr:VOC family protein [Rhodospirillales bacterium]